MSRHAIALGEGEGAMELLFWALIGALIGVAAAQRKGFNVAAGVLGGLLLGPLAFLMFFVSSVTRSDEKKKCPHCAEWIQTEAKVCRYCGRDVARKCPHCEAPNKPDANFCEACGRGIAPTT